MPDPRVSKLARVLVQYSLDLQPGEDFALMTSPASQELSLEIYKEATIAGAHVLVVNSLPGAREIHFKYASDAQLEYISSVMRGMYETFTAGLNVIAAHNTRELAGIDPNRQSLKSAAMAEIFKVVMERIARGEMKYCITLYPTNASAQEADMSLSDYQDFVYGAGLLDLADPVAAWKEVGEKQGKLIDWLAGKDEVVIKGSNIDMRMSIEGRTFKDASGRENFPDGEIFTSPVENSANGWVRFGYPAIYGGQEVTDIELWFEDGKVVKEKATKGQELLTAMLNTDDGSRILGELGLGLNYGIQRFTKNMLFDEKMGGTIHLAVGSGFPETGSKNLSGIHWDMLCDMAESEIMIDGELFYKNGKVEV